MSSSDGALHYISGAVQNYAWGKIGSDSIVARLNNASQPWEKIDEGKPYAEFWYATHPNGMSRVLPTPTSASAAEPPSPASCPDIQSSLLAGEPLPYIFKFLSINGALSLQAHPDKTLATRLHASYPDLYKDPNHKPELVVALSPMEALCGFRPLHEVAIFAAEIPEFAELLGDSAAALAPYATGANTAAATESVDAADASARSVLRDAFATAMRAPEAVVARLSAALAARLSAPSARPPAVSAALAATVASLSQQYPGDVGVFGPLLLNVLTIAPGQSVFLEPNAPHAYLYGECVEVLACSDNVVRVGLTPKFRDVETLVAMLTYSTATPRLHAGAPVDVPSFLTAAPATNSTATAAAAAAAAAAGTDDDTVAPAAAVSAAAVSAAAAAARLGLFAELSRVYAPPETFPEFMVTVTTVPPVAAAAAAAANAAGPPVDADQETEGTRPVPLPVLAGPSVLVCTAGTGSVSFDTDVLCSSSSTTAADAATAAGTDGRSLPLSFGSAILVPAGAAVSVRAHAAAGLTVFRGSANVSAVAQLCTEYSVQHAIRSPAAVPYADAGADAAAGTAHADVGARVRHTDADAGARRARTLELPRLSGLGNSFLIYDASSPSTAAPAADSAAGTAAGATGAAGDVPTLAELRRLCTRAPPAAAAAAAATAAADSVDSDSRSGSDSGSGLDTDAQPQLPPHPQPQPQPLYPPVSAPTAAVLCAHACVDGFIAALPEALSPQSLITPPAGSPATATAQVAAAVTGAGALLAAIGTNSTFCMRMYNSDGSDAEMCGNGVRCLAAQLAYNRSRRSRVNTQAQSHYSHDGEWPWRLDILTAAGRKQCSVLPAREDAEADAEAKAQALRTDSPARTSRAAPTAAEPVWAPGAQRCDRWTVTVGMGAPQLSSPVDVGTGTGVFTTLRPTHTLIHTGDASSAAAATATVPVVSAACLWLPRDISPPGKAGTPAPAPVLASLWTHTVATAAEQQQQQQECPVNAPTWLQFQPEHQRQEQEQQHDVQQRQLSQEPSWALGAAFSACIVDTGVPHCVVFFDDDDDGDQGGDDDDDDNDDNDDGGHPISGLIGGGVRLLLSADGRRRCARVRWRNVAGSPAAFAAVASRLCAHPAFPRGCNIEFVRTRAPPTAHPTGPLAAPSGAPTAAPAIATTSVAGSVDTMSVDLDVLVWERGCGPTQACGTGACAVAIAARLRAMQLRAAAPTAPLAAAAAAVATVGSATAGAIAGAGRSAGAQARARALVTAAESAGGGEYRTHFPGGRMDITWPLPAGARLCTVADSAAAVALGGGASWVPQVVMTGPAVAHCDGSARVVL